MASSGAPAGPTRESGAGHALRTLRHRDFSLLWSGQLISSIGDQMQQVAIGWHIYLLTDSPLQLGLVGAVRGVPLIVLSLLGGPLADTMDRRKLLWMTNAVQMFVTTALVLATLTGQVTPLLIYAISFVQGAASVFDAPARQAMIPNLVPRSELSNAFTLNTLMRQGSIIVGPGVGGLAVAGLGVAWTYAANALSFLAVVIAVWLLRPMPKTTSAPGTLWERFLGGWNYARQERLVLLPLGLDAWRSILIGTQVFTVIFASDIFLAGPEGVGALRTTIALGAVAGGFVLGTGRFAKRPVLPMVVGYMIEGLGLVGLALSPTLVIALFVMFFQGIGNVLAEVNRNTVVQLKTPDEVRGRVSALAQVATFGGPMLGQLQAGALVGALGPITACACDGLAIAAGAVFFGLLPPLRRAARDGID